MNGSNIYLVLLFLILLIVLIVVIILAVDLHKCETTENKYCPSYICPSGQLAVLTPPATT